MNIHRTIAYASFARHTPKVCSEYYKHSTGAKLVTRIMSKRYSSSSHVRCGMSTSIVETAVGILFFKELMPATRVSYSQTFTYNHRKSTQDVTSGDQADQAMAPACRSGKCWFKLHCGGAPSCWQDTARCGSCKLWVDKVYHYIQVTVGCHMKQATQHIDFGAVSNVIHWSMRVFWFPSLTREMKPS
jgi:hypothetical protein